MNKRFIPMPISLECVDTIFQEKKASSITIVRTTHNKWIFTFEAPTPTTGAIELCTLQTQRGSVREWSDPRYLFDWLFKRYGVQEGNFKILPKEK